MTLRSPVGAARGLGSARAGTQHWWLQRVTAVALIPLSVWLGGALVAMTGADHAHFSAWVARPLNAVGLTLAIGTALYHFKIGADVVIDDYVHSEGLKIASRMANLFGAAVIAAVSAFAVLKLAL
ncbi:MAG: succinate dehydrogenase, hydrophobic membrane anchor protein [Alphaproteobacteria bacterium]|nr:succinate dehydrogenase, hydrophobic membrane anchor protein [Alphaproteobacteria bacterium]